MPAYWKPDLAFFDLTRDKRAINAMVADIGSKSLAESCAGDTAKVQKAIIGNRILVSEADQKTGMGPRFPAERDPNPDWRSGWMQTPPARLVEGAGSPPADAWARIAGLFEGREDTGAPETQAFDQPDAA